MVEIILVQGFCPLKIKITQFPNGFCQLTNQDIIPEILNFSCPVPI